MKKIEFKPQLIGTDHAAIAEQMAKLDHAEIKLEILAKTWKQEFNETFTLQLFRSLPRPDENLVTRFLKIHQVELDPVIGSLYAPGKLKVEKLLNDNSYDFKDFRELTDNIISVKKFLSQNVKEDWLIQIFENNYRVPDVLKEAITTMHTHYTANLRENLVLEIASKTSHLINLLNNLGFAISPDRDLHAAFKGLLVPVSTGKKYKDLNFSEGEPQWNILNFVPGKGVTNKNHSIYGMLQNLSDEAIQDLYLKLKNK